MHKATCLAVALGVCICSACSKATKQTEAIAPDAAPTGAAHEVIIINYTYKPTTLTVPVGSTVTWVNRDIAPHTATHRAFGDEAFDTGQLLHDKTYVHTFPTAGSYTYICIFHQGMTGTIVVQ
jgi:plastocyanin